MKRIYLIDCPGVVPPSTSDSPQDILLRGVVRVENVEHPEQYIPAVLAKTKPQHIERTYQISGYQNHIEFLENLARKGGRLLHGGEPDVDGVAKMVLNDFLRGKIPWYTPVPFQESQEDCTIKGIEGRDGRLGEIGRKRKRDDASLIQQAENNESQNKIEEDEFVGFKSDDENKFQSMNEEVDAAFGDLSDDESDNDEN